VCIKIIIETFFDHWNYFMHIRAHAKHYSRRERKRKKINI